MSQKVALAVQSAFGLLPSARRKYCEEARASFSRRILQIYNASPKIEEIQGLISYFNIAKIMSSRTDRFRDLLPPKNWVRFRAVVLILNFGSFWGP